MIITCVVPPVAGAMQRSGTTTGVFVFPGCKSFPFILLDYPPLVGGRDIFSLSYI
jgi:hypothetical protein